MGEVIFNALNPKSKKPPPLFERNRNMNGSGKSIATGEKTDHQQIYDLLSDANTRLVEHKGRILKLSQALYGDSGAEVGSDRASKPARAGMVGQILDGVEELKELINDIDNVFNGLQR